VLSVTGRLGDIFGRKLVGVAGFTVASALCGTAVNPAMLIGTRFLQGTMIPQILSIIHATFPASERSKDYGLFGAIVGCASAAGMVVGGLLVQGDLLSAIQEVGMALGVALAGAVFFGYLGGPGQARPRPSSERWPAEPRDLARSRMTSSAPSASACGTRWGSSRSSSPACSRCRAGLASGIWTPSWKRLRPEHPAPKRSTEPSPLLNTRPADGKRARVLLRRISPNLCLSS
jgi:MFS family permease